jgi:hypothetical protein
MSDAIKQDYVTIKIKPYLKEYLECKLGEPVKAPAHEFIGLLFRTFLDTRPADVDHEFISGDEYLNIELKNYDFIDVRCGTIWIHPDNQKLFERFVEDRFRLEFITFMDATLSKNTLFQYRYKVRNNMIKDAIIDFCALNHIKFNHVSFDSLKKYYYRKSQVFFKKRPQNLSRRSHDAKQNLSHE